MKNYDRYREVAMRYENIRDQLKTGDALLFKVFRALDNSLCLITFIQLAKLIGIFLTIMSLPIDAFSQQAYVTTIDNIGISHGDFIPNIGRPVELVADPSISFLRIPPPAEIKKQFETDVSEVVTTNINYLPAGQGIYGDTCVEWPNEPRAAFDYAVRIWSSLLNSTVPITIDACWASVIVDNDGKPSPSTLGHAGSLGFHRNFENAPQRDTFYPSTLANALAGRDLAPGVADMHIAYNRNYDWYFGTDGKPPRNQLGGFPYDFASVVLHEIAHPLGFAGALSVSGGEGGWNGIEIYDRLTENGTGEKLISFTNPSVELANQLTGGNIFFNGVLARRANGGVNVPLHAPSKWALGSSYSHLAESYNGTDNALMTHSFASGEAIHDPGPVARGILADIGWTFTPPPPPPPPAPLSTYLSAILSIILDDDAPASYSLTVNNVGKNNGAGTVASRPTGINCGSNCSANFSSGANVTLTASPSTGSTFGGWSGGNAGCTGTGNCVVNMTAAKSVIATFNGGTSSNCQSPIAIGSTLSGNWTTGCASTHRSGSYAKFYTFTLSAPQTMVINLASTAADAYLFLLSGNGTGGTVLNTPGADDDAGGGNNARTTKALSAGTYTIEATTFDSSKTGAFSLSIQGASSTYPLTVNKAGTGTGTIASSPAGINNCSSTCTANFSGSVTLTATPTSKDSTFGGWSGAGCSGTGSCVVNMTAAQSVTATFNRNSTLPDLVVTSIYSSGIVNGLLHFGVKNQGGQAAGRFRTRLYLSTDPIITPSDILSMEACEYQSLAAGASSECYASAFVPDSVLSGTYYVGAFVDPFNDVTESNETNNSLAAPDPITVTHGGSTVPQQLAPPNGTVFNHYPRTTTLQWTGVPGAESYTVEIEYLDSSLGWAAIYNGIRTGIRTESFTFDFVGAQPGRWRVFAVVNGVNGPSSGWWEFSYTQ